MHLGKIFKMPPHRDSTNSQEQETERLKERENNSSLTKSLCCHLYKFQLLTTYLTEKISPSLIFFFF